MKPQRVGPLSYEAGLDAQLRYQARIAELEDALKRIANLSYLFPSGTEAGVEAVDRINKLANAALGRQK